MAVCVVGGLRIATTDDPALGVLRLDWTGKSNHPSPQAPLSAFFAEVTSRAVSERKTLDMHFEALEFFNSSTITAIIAYAKELRERRVKVTVHYDPSHRWQKIFFDALQMFDKGDGLFVIVGLPPSSRPPSSRRS